MNYIFHRGFHEKKQEENKITGFIKAFQDERCIGIETDIRITKDQVFILYHSPLFHEKLVQNCLYKEFLQENVPKLEDLLKINTSKIMLLEIKDFNINIAKLLKILNKYDRQIYLMSFSNKVIKKLYEAKTKYKIGVLNYVFNTINNYPYNFICILNDLLNWTIIETFKKKNIELISYGVHNYKDMVYPNLTYIINNEILVK